LSTLVTGGAGYIGSHTVQALRRAGRDVVVLDTLEKSSRRAVGDVPRVVGDIADADLVAATVAEHGVTGCVHFAAYKSVGESMLDPGRYYRNNVAGTAALVEALLGAGVGRLVFSSTCATYGTPAVLPVDEATPVAPDSVYGESKLVVERLLAWYGRLKPLQSVSLRYFNAAGAAADGSIGEDWSHSTNLVPVAMKAVLGAGPPVQVFGDDYDTPDGTGVRDYIHVEDLAEAHVRALEHLEGGGGTTILNLGTGTGSSVTQVLDATARAAGRPVPHEVVARRPGDVPAIWADPAAAERVLGWRATRGLDEIVGSAYRWHASQLAEA
jgi:UDP-glucose-4-epimerase GalE